MDHTNSRATPIIRRVSLPDGGTLPISAGLHMFRENGKPYFSITATEYDKRGREVAGGCMHEAILAHCPDLAPIVALHLSDVDGKPSHADANGWYWLSGAAVESNHFRELRHGSNGTEARTPEECLHIFMKHARVSSLDAENLMIRLYNRACEMAHEEGSTEAGDKAARRLFTCWIEQQETRWAREAAAVIGRFDLKVFGDQWGGSM